MMSAYVFTQIGSIGGLEGVNDLHHALHAIAGVKSVHFLAGPTDVMLYIEAADQMALMQVVGKVREQKGVMSTDTRIVLPI